MLFILLLLVAIVFYFVYNSYKRNKNDKIVRCNMNTDDSCKMYNQRDIRSKCSSMCIEQNARYIFTGNHKHVGNDHVCECDYPEEKFTLNFTNINNNPDILPDIVPNDIKVAGRKYVEKEQEKRYGGLIFGVE